jgi:hypothetical protein
MDTIRLYSFTCPHCKAIYNNQFEVPKQCLNCKETLLSVKPHYIEKNRLAVRNDYTGKE